MSKQWFAILILTFVSITVTVWLLFFDGINTATIGFWQVYDWVQGNRLQAAGVFFLISLASQLIIMPSGSLMLLVAGFALGGVLAAAVFALAQVLVTWPVYYLSDNATRGIEKRLQKGAGARRIELVKAKLKVLRTNELLATMLLRLTPVIPSAGACVLASVSGIKLQSFLIGTVLTCWIRPLFFSSSGEAMSEVVLRDNTGGMLGQLNLWPLFFVFFSVLLLFVVTVYLRLRTQRADEQ